LHVEIEKGGKIPEKNGGNTKTEKKRGEKGRKKGYCERRGVDSNSKNIKQ
jgi:hypothetical protein